MSTLRSPFVRCLTVLVLLAIDSGATSAGATTSFRSGTGFFVTMGKEGEAETIVVSTRSTLYRLDGRDGHIQWRRGVNEFVAGPVLTSGVVVLLVEQGYALIGLDAIDGRERWRLDSADPTWVAAKGRSMSVVTDGRWVYVGMETPIDALKIDPLTGKVVWAHVESQSRPDGSRFSNDIVPLGASVLVAGRAVDAETGRDVPGVSSLASACAVASDDEARLAVAYRNGELSRITARTLQSQWTVHVQPSEFCGLAVAGELIALTGRASPQEKRVTAFKGTTGQQLWSRVIPDSSYQASRPSVGRDALVVAGWNERDGYLIALEGRTGETRWRYDASGLIFGGDFVVVGPSVILVERTSIRCLDAEVGRVVWTATLSSDQDRESPSSEGR